MKHIILLLILLTSLLGARESLNKVSLQLLWLDQFQFAGYYMAKEKGFYKEAGFKVDLKKVKDPKEAFSDVVSGKTTFGIGRSSLIKFDSSGEKISLLSAIFQSSPDIILALDSSNINSVQDFQGRSVMQTEDLIQNASLNTMLQSVKLSLKDIQIIPHNYNLNSLIEKRVDLYSAYISNEPFLLKQKGVKFHYFSPKIEGFDFYSDILYTSQKYALEHPLQVEKFTRATLKGWEYAFSHIEESVNLILEKYNTQHKSKEAFLYEAKELKNLAYYNNNKLGSITQENIQRIYDIYKVLRVMKAPLDMKKLLFDYDRTKLSFEEMHYLKKKHYIRYCTQSDALPYSAVEDNKFIGIGSGILELAEKTSGIEFRLVPTQTWQEALLKAKNRECDLLPMASATPSRREYFNFTDVYYDEPLVVITRKEENYILNITTVLDKTFSAVAGNAFIENLKRIYPSLKITEVKSIKEGLDGVESGKYFGHIDVMMSSAYALQKLSKINLKISGQFEESAKVSFAVRKDDAVLFGIMNKLAHTIKKENLQPILNRWISINYTKGTVKWYYKEIAFGVVLFLILMFYREYFLKKKNLELEGLKERLVILNEQLENKAFEATKELEKAQEIAKLGSWVMNLTTKELTWSKETYKIFDISPEREENLYESFIQRVHPDDREDLEHKYAFTLANKQTYHNKYRLLMDDGSIKYVVGNAVTKFSANGEAILRAGTIQDVTQTVLKEEEMKKKDIFIMHQARLAQMGEMLSMIAHQWKQPLSAISSTQISIKSTIELEKYNLEEKKERESFLIYVDERLDKIALYVQNLSKTIKDFSDFYKPTKESELLNIDAVVKKAYELVSDMMQDSAIEVEFELEANLSIAIYENEFMQVILNLLTNSKEQLIEKKINNPKIYVKSYLKSDKVMIEFEDNAGGVEEGILESVFDPYFSTKLEKNGTGLGLYMCKMIINEYHRGNISIQNTEDGVKFTIELER